MFRKKVEDFQCEKCGKHIIGDGFTNHCTNCLWSKHVDVEPGDRASNCGGLMEPVSLEKVGDSYIITHKCTVCGHEKKNKSNSDDDFSQIIDLSKKLGL